MFTDNKDFYPTPHSLYRLLVKGNRYISHGKILEPSAGKGNLIDYLQEGNRNRKVKVDAIEKDSSLANDLMAKGINVVWDDFLTFSTYKEYDVIIMNPPFSSGVDHLLKAIELAENQISNCDIYAILNKNTLDNTYTDKRKSLLNKLDRYNADVEYVQDGFANAERKTGVEVALIRINITSYKERGKSIYDSIPFVDFAKNDAELSTALSNYVKSRSIEEKMNDIERYVLEYEKACELTKNHFEAYQEKQSFLDYIGKVNQSNGILSDKFTHVIRHKYSNDDMNEELNRIRLKYWELILDTDSFREILTNEGIQQLNKRLSAAEGLEVNLANIRMLLTAMGVNKNDMLIESIVNIFKKITGYHMNQYSTNIHYYDGWKTNDAYKINKKIIIPIKYSPFDVWDLKEEYSKLSFEVKNFIEDLVKAFQMIDPRFNNEFETVGKYEFENTLLRFKMFKNGNIHIWFNDLDALKKMNYICGQHFNWIPSDDEIKANKKAREFVVKEFGDFDTTIKLAV
ncbi:DUF4942 domain-containing protein [Lentibacillus sp. N15]|uniref:DUF4942 domain-containing protein n=1 Tax=Lentibacillus songyuanensis TaxID=3136161 RepID=UPI0031BB8A4A